MVVQITGGIFGSLLVAGLVPGTYVGEAQLLETSHMHCKCRCLNLLLAKSTQCSAAGSGEQQPVPPLDRT